MSLAVEDRKKCVQLWKWATGETTTEDIWNEAAADLLAQMYAEIVTCSKRMNFVPRPAGSRPGWFWLLKQAFDVLYRNLTASKNEVYVACKNTAVYYYKRSIEAALSGL